MKLPETAYLATPYSYKTSIPFLAAIVRYYRKREATRIGALLTEKYDVSLVLPITQSGEMAQFLGNADAGFERWERIDLALISACKAIWVVMMPGWKESIGVQAEIKFARKQGFPVLYIDPKTLKRTSKCPTI